MTRTRHDPEDAGEISISRITLADAEELLTVQRAAFVSEALIYGSADMPPLTQTLAELEAELRDADGWVARVDGRLVGAIRTREQDGLLLIGRIAIAPDQQGLGIGGALLEAAESATDAEAAELFTGSLSEANIRLYERCGYVESTRVEQGDGIAEIYFRKQLRTTHPSVGGDEPNRPPRMDQPDVRGAPDGGAIHWHAQPEPGGVAG